MNRPFVFVAGLILANIAQAADPVDAPPPKYQPPAIAAPMSARECEVWNRELAFARTVEHHDAKAFSGYVYADAVFINGALQATRGREAISREWAPLIAGDDVRLHWYPGAVHIGGKTDVALSHGVFWIENLHPDAPHHWLVGQFISTWIRDRDGKWRVLYDGGDGGHPVPVSDADVAALLASFPKTCPR